MKEYQTLIVLMVLPLLGSLALDACSRPIGFRDSCDNGVIDPPETCDGPVPVPVPTAVPP